MRLLGQLYSAFDALVDKHCLEKIKVSGDSKMYHSGQRSSTATSRPCTSACGLCHRYG
ncbi:adenylate/guanylate cyclase domain-containing protein [Mycobacterium leprae]|uniref:adenylate/guanylate cyclase domain-containing protein n=1 Tax=Mycobacterium leprae TaxID=1769 RepID=UPI0022AB07EC|nr:adenylate/guanylate cyclase domain-containing protein [Mycobacterium leprae]